MPWRFALQVHAEKSIIKNRAYARHAQITQAHSIGLPARRFARFLHTPYFPPERVAGWLADLAGLARRQFCGNRWSGAR